MRRILRSSALRDNPRRDVNDELRFHIDMRTQEFMEQGMPREEARRAALRAFGDVGAIDDELRIERESLHRRRARRERLSDLTLDVRFALRTLRKNVGFTVAALATLALGIGAATAVFTVVNGVLLRPLPYPDPSRVVLLWMASKQYGEELPLSSGFYTDVARVSKSTAVTTAMRAWRFTLARGGGRANAEQIDGVRVTPSFFTVIGVRPALGRAFADADAEIGASPTVILSDALWRGEFGADESIVGRPIEMSGQRFTVVGVMPPDFTFPRGAEMPAGLEFANRTQLWTPLAFSDSDRASYAVQNLAVMARLAPGASAEQFRIVVSAELERWRTAVAPKLDLHYSVSTLREQAGLHVRRGLVFLLVVVALLLCIACANVTNLLIVRTARRQREFAVRTALGAGRLRIARQLVTENVLLAVGGSMLGFGVSMWATRAMLALVPGSMPRADDIRVDWRVALVVAAVALAAGAAFGFAAATQAGLDRVAAALRDDGSRATGSRSAGTGRRALVVAEMSLSLMLLIGAALLTVSFMRLQRVAPGFDPSQVMTANVSLPVPGAFDPGKDGPTWARVFSELQNRLAQSPGIDAAGAVSILPLGDAAEQGSTWTVGDPPVVAGKAHVAEYMVVQGDYFRAMRIPLLSGRAFDASDVAATTPVVIVNREYVHRFLGDSPSVMAKQIRTFFDFSTGRRARQIIGVVGDVHNGSLEAPPQPQVYLPESQMNYPSLQVVLRTHGDEGSALTVLRREVNAVDPSVAVSRSRPMQAVFDESLARQRFSMTLIAFFAGAALVLSMIGLYGVISLGVNSRRRELGLRMALGAQPRDVLRLVLNEGLAMALAGVAIGLLGAYAVNRLVATLLYGVSATNAAIYATAALITVLVTLGATLVPARRATRVDPTVALRGD